MILSPNFYPKNLQQSKDLVNRSSHVKLEEFDGGTLEIGRQMFSTFWLYCCIITNGWPSIFAHMKCAHVR